MSKKCPICKSINCIVEVGKAGAGKPWFTCLHCHTDLWEEEILPVTVFDKITESVEMLAEKLVYRRNCKMIHQNDKTSLEYCTYSWKSSIIKGQSFETYEEAIAATIEELKKVWKR